MAFDPAQIEVFRYVGTEVDPAADGALHLRAG